MEHKNYKHYELGPDVWVHPWNDNIKSDNSLTIGNVVSKMFATDGVDDKIYFTITSMETGNILFSGRNAYLVKMPIQLFVAPILAIDDVGDDNGMNFYISTSLWTLK